MRTSWVRLSMLMVLSMQMVLGCNKSQSTPVAEVVTDVEPISEPPAHDGRPPAGLPKDESREDPSSADPTSAIVDSEPDSSPATPSELSPEHPPAPAPQPDDLDSSLEPKKQSSKPARRPQDYRMLLPTSAGLLIVDAEIEINGVSLQENFSTKIQQLISAAAEDDQSTSWQALFQHVASEPMRFGNAARVNRQQYRQLISRYDHDRDQVPDQREVAKYLFQGSPTSLPFRLSGTDRYRDVNRSESTIFQALDVDSDRLWDEQEIEQSARNLFALDRNADRRLDIGELSTSSDPSEEVWRAGRAKRWGEVAMDLTDRTDWSMLSYMMGDLSDSGPFGQSAARMATLDVDHDGSLDADETAGLLTVSPDLRIRIVFAPGKPGSIALDWIASEIDSRVETHTEAQQIQINGPSFSLVSRLHASPTGANQFPDQAFSMLDANADGFLDPNEVPAPALREYSFEEIDTNADGKLTLAEIRIGLAGKEPFWFIQIRARGAESPDAVFRWLDQNHDNILSTREIETAPQLLRTAAKGGVIRSADIPDSYLLQFGRGDPRQDSQLFATAIRSTSTPDQRPRWAQAMDFNRDGDISRLEFTGTDEQFATIDLDRDGFLSQRETASR